MATTLNIGGKKIKVDDSFNDLDAAGQKKVIRRIERDLGVSSSQPAKNEQRGTSLKDVARFGLGQGLALGFGDEIEAGVTSLFGNVVIHADVLCREVRAVPGTFMHSHDKNSPAVCIHPFVV